MKISVFGMLPFSQLIKEGFEKLGHEISSKSPELIFSNDPSGYEQSLILKKKYPNAYFSNSTNLVHLNLLFSFVSFACSSFF